MRILSVDIGIGPMAGGGSERTYRVNAELLRLGLDVGLMITDRWMTGGQMPPGYPFPEERIIVLRSLNHRFNVPHLPIRRIADEISRADVVHLNGHLWPGAMVVGFLAQRQRKPVVITTLGALPLRGRSMLLKRLTHLAVSSRMLRRAAAFIAVTEAEAVNVRPHGSPHTITEVIPNGISATPTSRTALDFRDRFGLGSEPYILFVGTLHPTKGVDLLIDAFARSMGSHDHRLVIAGSGYEEHALREAAVRHSAQSRIVFTGQLEPDWRTAAIRGSSFVAIPSRLDAMTMVVLEAAIEAKPVLMTRTCGFPDIEPSGGGICVDPNVDSISTGLRWMMDRRPEWAAMGENMRRLADQYTWSRAALKHLELFERVAGH